MDELTQKEKVERSTQLAIAACRRKYGDPQILGYECLESLLDRHKVGNYTDIRAVWRESAERRQEMIEFIRKMRDDSRHPQKNTDIF